MAEKKRRPTAPAVPGNPLARLVKERLRHLRQQPLTTIRTVRDVAALLGVQESTLNTYLNGRRRATAEVCDRLAIVLGLETATVEAAATATDEMRAAAARKAS